MPNIRPFIEELNENLPGPWIEDVTKGKLQIFSSFSREEYFMPIIPCDTPQGHLFMSSGAPLVNLRARKCSFYPDAHSTGKPCSCPFYNEAKYEFSIEAGLAMIDMTTLGPITFNNEKSASFVTTKHGKKGSLKDAWESMKDEIRVQGVCLPFVLPSITAGSAPLIGDLFANAKPDAESPKSSPLLDLLIGVNALINNSNSDFGNLYGVMVENWSYFDLFGSYMCGRIRMFYALNVNRLPTLVILRSVYDRHADLNGNSHPIPLIGQCAELPFDSTPDDVVNFLRKVPVFNIKDMEPVSESDLCMSLRSVMAVDLKMLESNQEESTPEVCQCSEQVKLLYCAGVKWPSNIRPDYPTRDSLILANLLRSELSAVLEGSDRQAQLFFDGEQTPGRQFLMLKLTAPPPGHPTLILQLSRTYEFGEEDYYRPKDLELRAGMNERLKAAGSETQIKEFMTTLKIGLIGSDGVVMPYFTITIEDVCQGVDDLLDSLMRFINLRSGKGFPRYATFANYYLPAPEDLMIHRRAFVTLFGALWGLTYDNYNKNTERKWTFDPQNRRMSALPLKVSLEAKFDVHQDRFKGQS